MVLGIKSKSSSEKFNILLTSPKGNPVASDSCCSVSHSGEKHFLRAVRISSSYIEPISSRTSARQSWNNLLNVDVSGHLNKTASTSLRCIAIDCLVPVLIDATALLVVTFFVRPSDLRNLVASLTRNLFEFVF